MGWLVALVNQTEPKREWDRRAIWLCLRVRLAVGPSWMGSTMRYGEESEKQPKNRRGRVKNNPNDRGKRAILRHQYDLADNSIGYDTMALWTPVKNNSETTVVNRDWRGKWRPIGNRRPNGFWPETTLDRKKSITWSRHLNSLSKVQ